MEIWSWCFTIFYYYDFYKKKVCKKIVKYLNKRKSKRTQFAVNVALHADEKNCSATLVFSYLVSEKCISFDINCPS